TQLCQIICVAGFRQRAQSKYSCSAAVSALDKASRLPVHMKIAAAQISCSLGNPDANLLKVRDFAARAKQSGAELIVFPEMIDTGYSMSVIQTHAASWTSGFVPGLQEAARELSIAMVCGVSERDAASIYNSQILVDQNGEVAAKYRKTHLYAVAPVEEQTCF